MLMAISFCLSGLFLAAHCNSVGAADNLKTGALRLYVHLLICLMSLRPLVPSGLHPAALLI